MTHWTIAHQAPLSMGFLRQEYGSGLPLPCPDNRDVWCMYKGSQVFRQPPSLFLSSSLPPAAPSPQCLPNEGTASSPMHCWSHRGSHACGPLAALRLILQRWWHSQRYVTSQGFDQLGVGSLPGGEAEGLVGDGQGPRGRNTHHGGKQVSRSSQGHLSGVRDSARQGC